MGHQKPHQKRQTTHTRHTTKTSTTPKSNTRTHTSTPKRRRSSQPITQRDHGNIRDARRQRQTHDARTSNQAAAQPKTRTMGRSTRRTTQTHLKMNLQLDTKYWEEINLDQWRERNLNTAYIYTIPLLLWTILTLIQKQWWLTALNTFYIIGTTMRTLSYNKYKKHQREKIR